MSTKLCQHVLTNMCEDNAHTYPQKGRCWKSGHNLCECVSVFHINRASPSVVPSLVSQT